MRSTKTHKSLECSEAGCSQRAEKATAADIRCYVNDQHTSAEHKLEAADIKANRAEASRWDSACSPFQPTLLGSEELS